MSLEALVSLTSEHARAVGRDRIRLLEAVARGGSITVGAKAIGITYKAAWDALDAMANLFGQPLLVTRAGGKAGGGATLTATGVRIIEAFHRLEAEMARVLRKLEPDLAGTGITRLNLVSGFLMKTSARNALRGTITADAITAEVATTLRASPRRAFWTVAVPLAMPGFLTGAVLGFTHTVDAFGVVLMIGGNIPGQTKVLSVAICDDVKTFRWREANILAACNASSTSDPWAGSPVLSLPAAQ